MVIVFAILPRILGSNPAEGGRFLRAIKSVT
jgi:hypothetical protein